MIVTVLVVAAFAGTGAAEPPASFKSYQAHMAAAEKSLRLNQSPELVRWLAAAPNAHRGWEWDYLKAVSDTSARSVPAPGGPSRIAIAPHGTRLATVEGDVVRIRSYPSFELLRTIEGHDDAIYRAEFSADGARLITVSRDVTSRVWDVATGEEIARIELANPAFAAATLSPDGAVAATCAWERVDGEVHGLVWVWDAATGAVRVRTRVGVKPLSSIRYTPDGRHIVVGSWDGLVHVLDTDAAEVRTLTLPDEDVYNAVNDIAVSRDGRFVAAAAKDRTVRVFDLATGDLLASLRGHGDYVEGVAFSPDDATLASCGRDTTARFWRVGDWSPAGILRGHQATVGGVAWTADSTGLVSCSLDDTLRVWDRGALHAAQLDIETGTNGIYSAALTPDGRIIAVACYDGWVRLFDARNGSGLGGWEAHPGSTCHGAAFDAAGSRLITCSWDETARVWDMSTYESIAVLEAGSGVYAAVLSPDGKRAALTAGALQFFDVDAGKRIKVRSLDGETPSRLVFSPDGVQIASGWSDGAARVEGDTAWTHVLGEPGGPRVETVAFTPDGSHVVTGDAAGVVRVFSSRGGDPLFEYDTGERGVHHVAVSGDRIAAGTDRLWLIDLGTGRPVLDHAPHADAVWHLSWSADGLSIATCDINGTIAVLSATP